MAKTNRTQTLTLALAPAYRKTLTALLNGLDPRMTTNTRQFWICLWTVANFGISDVNLVAKITGFNVTAVKRYLPLFVSLGYIRNGKIVGGFMNHLTHSIQIPAIGGVPVGTTSVTRGKLKRRRNVAGSAKVIRPTFGSSVAA